MIECILCATEFSKNEIENVCSNKRVLDEHLKNHGLKRVEVQSDGHCIIHSWRLGLTEGSSNMKRLAPDGNHKQFSLLQ